MTVEGGVRANLSQGLAFLPSAAFYLIALGLSVSGIVSRTWMYLLIGAGTIALVLAIAMRSPLRRIRLTLAPSSPNEKYVLVATTTSNELYTAASELLRAVPHSQLLIYAPTGVWEADDAKKAWFCTIATCLLNARRDTHPEILDEDIDHKAKETKVELASFKGVFGLPPVPRPPGTQDSAALERYLKEKNEFARQLADIERTFRPFKGIDTAQIRYLDTDVRGIPGTGVIIFDTTAVTVGFATTGRYQVGYAFTIQQASDIGSQLQQWFNGHLSSLVDDNVLQDMRTGTDVTKGFRDLRELYGIS